MMPPEDLGVLDLAGHDRVRHAGLLQHVMHVPSWPSEIQWIAAPCRARPRRRARETSLPSTAMIVTSCPWRTRGVEDEKRETAVAGDEPELHFVGDELLGLAASDGAG